VLNHGLVARLGQGYPVAKLQSSLKNSRIEVVAPQSANPLVLSLIAGLREKLPTLQLVIVATGREAEDLERDLRFLEPDSEVLLFPSWETLPHERLSPIPETVGQRLRTIARLSQIAEDQPTTPIYLIVSIRAAIQPLVSGLDKFPPLELSAGQEYLLPELSLKLVEQAYQRVDMVSKRGEFAVRGGILDIFPTTSEHAVRLEFFGDELEEIREFSVSDQRSSAIKLEMLTLYPARELIITPLVASKAREMMHEFPNLGAMLEKISLGIPVEGMESLAPALADGMVSLFDYLPKSLSVAVLSPEKVAARAASLVETNEEFLHAAWDAAMDGASAPIDLSGGGFVDFASLSEKFSKLQVITISPFGMDSEEVVNLGILDVPNFKGPESSALEWVLDQLAQDHMVVISSEISFQKDFNQYYAVKSNHKIQPFC
jgi:transcription-repair coupling factor (superfamily II helicase)